MFGSREGPHTKGCDVELFVVWTLQKYRRVRVGSSKTSEFLKDLTQVQQHFWRVQGIYIDVDNLP